MIPTNPHILVVDNYDSFAYNLVQYVGEAVTTDAVLPDVTDGEVTVRRNDDLTLSDLDDLDPDAIVVSPGPGTPAAAGISVPLFAERTYPTLGVCLGHQALCAANGGTVGHADAVVHGKPSIIFHDGNGVFEGLPDQFEVGRYHSLAVDREDLPESLVETAWTDTHDSEMGTASGDDVETRVVMGVRHRSRPHVGVQFHPESILTEEGKNLIAAFLRQYCCGDDAETGQRVDA